MHIGPERVRENKVRSDICHIKYQIKFDNKMVEYRSIEPTELKNMEWN